MNISSMVFNLYGENRTTTVKLQRRITPKINRQELHLWAAHHLIKLYISVKFHENILKGFLLIQRQQNYNCQISKENNSKNRQELRFLSSACRLMMIYISMKVSWKYPDRFSIYRPDTQLLLSKFLKGRTPKIYKQELWFLWSACRLMILYIEWTRNDHGQISKKNNSKNVDKSYGSCGVHVVWWCFILLWSFMKISWRFSHEIAIVEFQRRVTPKIIDKSYGSCVVHIVLWCFIFL